LAVGTVAAAMAHANPIPPYRPHYAQGDTYSHSDAWPENCVLGTYPISSPKWIEKLKKAMAAAFRCVPHISSQMPHDIYLDL